MWSHQWEQANNHTLFAQAFGLGPLVTLGGFFVLLLDARANSRMNPYLHGSARCADKRDIQAAGLLNNDGVYDGAWRDKAVKFTISDTLVPSTFSVTLRRGAEMGVGLIVPTLLSWKQSVFVTDLKGELYELTAGWRHEHAHNRILRFEPAAAADSCCFNPNSEIEPQDPSIHAALYIEGSNFGEAEVNVRNY